MTATADQKYLVFQQGVQAVFQRWTALRLAIMHGEQNAPAKAQALLEATIARVAVPTFPDWTELSDFLDDSMEQDFATMVEDDSCDEVAQMVINIAEACRVGNFEGVERLVASHLPALDVVPPAGGGEGESSGEEGEWGEGGEWVDDDQEREQAMPRESKPEPEVDADGFVTVTHRHGRRH